MHTFQLKPILKIRQVPLLTFWTFFSYLLIFLEMVPIALITLPTMAAEHYATLPSLITQYGCQSCHALNVQRNAPSFESIAQRYHTMPEAKRMLVQKLRTGSVGAWGSVSMPPQAMISDEALAPIIDWVLAQSPKKK